MKDTITQYRITGRLAKDPEDKRFIITSSREIKSMKEAEIKLAELQKQESDKIKNGASFDQCGIIGVVTKHYDGYKIVDMRIETREVTPWFIQVK